MEGGRGRGGEIFQLNICLVQEKGGDERNFNQNVFASQGEGGDFKIN